MLINFEALKEDVLEEILFVLQISKDVLMIMLTKE